MANWQELSPKLLAGLLGGAGVLHFVLPKPYEGIVPPLLGNPRAWVYGSGVAELAVGAVVLGRKTRGYGGLAAAALFCVVVPANVQMAIDSHGGTKAAIAYARLPLQIPLVWWGLSVAKANGRGIRTLRSA